MKFKRLAIILVLLTPHFSLASLEAEAEKVQPTYKIVSLETEIAQSDPGRKYHSERAIVEKEVTELVNLLLEGELPAKFSWHGGRINSVISGIVGKIPETLKKDKTPTGRFFNYSVPALSFADLREKPIPDYDMVVRYVTLEQVEHFFAVTLSENEYVGKQDKN